MKKIKILFCFLAILLAVSVLSPGGRAEEAGEIDVPIIMYHAVSDVSSRLGRYTISPAEFEADLRYLKDHGYEAVTMTELIAYVHEGKSLPEKPVVLTFDDGSSGDYQYVFPILKSQEMKAVTSIIVKVTDEYTADAKEGARYPHLIWPQVQEMVESGYMEVQNHSYNLHSGCGADKRRGESEESYRLRVSEDLARAQARISEMTGTLPNTFTYPFGAYCRLSEEVLQELGFSASLICEARMNHVKQGDPDCLFRLGRIIRPHGQAPAEIFGKFGIE